MPSCQEAKQGLPRQPDFLHFPEHDLSMLSSITSIKKTPTTTQRAPPMVLCGAVAIRVLQVPTHALLLSVVEAMERTSAS